MLYVILLFLCAIWVFQIICQVMFFVVMNYITPNANHLVSRLIKNRSIERLSP